MEKLCEISDVSAEAAVIASLLEHPEFVFYSEQLTPHHFTNKANGYMYYAIGELVKMGYTKIDTYDIIHILEMHPATKSVVESVITVDMIDEFREVSSGIARDTVEAYSALAKSVLNAAFRRETYNKLTECQHLCFNAEEKEISQKIYSTLDDVMMKFSTTNEIPEYKDVIDECWAYIKKGQESGHAGIPFKFPALNEYATIERTELFIFAAEQKQGKSIMLLNCAVDLLKQGYSVLYLDSELNTRLFTARILSHLSGVEYKRLKSGRYTEDEEKRILECIEWLKTKKFTHICIPMFDQQSIYTSVKKVMHTQGIDVLIIDYFKGKGEGDAFDSYQELGRFVDLIKNQICGEMNIAGIGAAQATSSGKLADSIKIARNGSTIAIITDKTPEEIAEDGEECGNKKLRIVYNRNGTQMAQDEYIDLKFDGNHILYEQAKQHIPQTPY